MPSFRRVLPILLASVALISGGRTNATHRADFFTTNKPTVSFDKGKMLWVLRNQILERTVQFEPRAGTLKTLALRDLKHNRTLLPDGGFEGSVDFAAPLMEPPVPLNGWKMTATAPADNWAKPSFDDGKWQAVALPYKTNEENKTWYFRCALPADRMKTDHNYALLFDNAIDDEAEIYVDGQKVQTVTASEQPWSHLVQIDLTAQNRTVAVKLSGHGKPNGLIGTVSIAEEGTAPASIALDKDWKYQKHSIRVGETGGQVLTVSLAGLRSHEGLDLDVNYEIAPGDEPTTAKWFTLVNHRTTRFLVEKVTYDRWTLPGGSLKTQTFPGTAFAASDPASGQGVLTAVLSPLGTCERGAAGYTVAPILRPGYAPKQDVPLVFPHSVTSYYHGPTETGAFLYQLYIGQYVSRATPDSVPVLYNTWFGYLGDINAATCEKIIPLASDLGVKLFVIDDGWQTNNAPDTGKYGDWLVDRRSDKFPQGLLPISTLVRENKMRFGLWTAPIMVSEKAQAVVDHPNWLLRHTGNAPVKQWDGTWGMCFTTGWQDNYTESFVQLARGLSLSYLKLDSGLFDDACVDPTHDHPVHHSEAAQIDGWNAFGDAMRKVDKTFILDRGWEAGPEVTAWQDEGWFGDWEIGYDPKRQQDAGWWVKNADIYRRTLYDLTSVRPPFTIGWETPCHIPTATPDLNALEYHFTSIGAYISNVEIHGKLELMTPDEKALMKKWIQWNADNRPWLAYAQPLTSLGKPSDPRDAASAPHIDGVLHLRNVLNGRYGYVCLWNPGDKADKASVAFDPGAYFVRMTPNLKIVRLKDNKELSYKIVNGQVSLADIAMTPRSWEIYEIRERK